MAPLKPFTGNKVSDTIEPSAGAIPRGEWSDGDGRQPAPFGHGRGQDDCRSGRVRRAQPRRAGGPDPGDPARDPGDRTPAWLRVARRRRLRQPSARHRRAGPHRGHHPGRRLGQRDQRERRAAPRRPQGAAVRRRRTGRQDRAGLPGRAGDAATPLGTAPPARRRSTDRGPVPPRLRRHARAATGTRAAVQTRGRGQWWRLAGGAGLAFALAVTGVSLPELGLHRALTSPDRPATFVPPKLTPSTTTEPPPGPRISVEPNPNVCPDLAPGRSAACPVLTIRSSGAAALLVRSFELVGPAAGEFRVGTDATGTSGGDLSCLGRPLAPGDACSVQVSFQPTQSGLRSATLVVHQNLPRPDTDTPVDLIGHGIGEPTTT